MHDLALPTITDLLFKKSGAGLCLVAPDGTVVRANAEWLRSTGLSEAQTLGENIVELAPETRDLALAMHTRARAGRRVEVPRHARTVNGRDTWWEGSIEPVAMEDGIGLLITACEVSAGVDAVNPELAAITQEAKYRRLFENSMHAVYLTRAGDGTILDANPAACRMHGMTVEEIRERGRAGLVVMDEAFLSGLKRQAATGQAGGENTFLRKDGTTFPVEVESVYLDKSSPRPLAFTLARDITDQKRAERVLRDSEERLRALADSMPLLAWSARPDGYIEWFNRRCYEYTGKTLEELEGWKWQSIHDPETLPEVLRAWNDALEAGRMLDMELPLRGADGKFRRFLSRAVPLKDDAGKVVHWFGTHTDVTELVEAREVLRAANRSKDGFLAVLSHELRNPLAPLRTSAYILGQTKLGSEQARHAHSVIERQTEHLARLVDDLLDLTRIVRGKIELRRERVDLREVVWRAADDYRLLMDQAGVAFRAVLPDSELWADADSTRIAQVVGNLLHNSLKFTKRGGEVVLSLRADGDEAEIHVRDDGAGIDPKLVERVFEPFVQADQSLARTRGGLGLGLALVKGIAELHGGSARAESAGSGKGAEFVVRLPLAPAAAADRAEAPAPPLAKGGRRVLVVDDDRDAAESLADIVRMLGHTAEVTLDGPSAIEYVRANSPDIVLCDLALPGMTGYDVARALRAEASTARLVAVSGDAQPGEVEKAVQAGFDAHVAKPTDLAELEKLLG